ncbi:DUF4123 domain-containing protein [Pseudoduganella albidiflava]|uniref:DUF4123 domain-containing protein n=1 Tax=Pseudoduganella albidiflava TaxID=321983 RepID=A0A411X1K1_9BURK|nr:DUF4123 domain-containing protein [Pseudoduganella albidiflava]QBI02732.1 DUF4123 domain-containing protein [Pseudoduganella albidiflava]GGY55856.1 hypothetical protein GCM10007387_42820 [Pseudoduganella albidiflava]
MTSHPSASDVDPQIDRAFALIDLAAHDGAFDGLVAQFPTVRWESLFANTPEAHLLSAAPLLIDLDPAQDNKALVSWLVSKERLSPSVTWIKSRFGLQALAAMLTRRLTCRINDGEEVLLRFYDPRVLLGLPSALTPVQKKFFFAPVVSWTAWEFRRQAYYGIDAEPATAAEISAFSVMPITLDERQRERLMYYDKEALYDSIVTHWEENSPEAIGDMEPDMVREAAIAAVARCDSYGIHNADDQHLFAGLMMRVSPSFDAHPMVLSYLRDETIPPQERLSKMIDELPPAIWRQIGADKRYEALFEHALPA